MIITPEQAALKAQEQFDALRDFVQQAAQEKQRIDTVERSLMRQLLALGQSLLSAFVAQQGDGDLGPEAETAGGQTARRLPERHDRRYVSIFGELAIDRVVYGTREGQRIERVPLDERLGLPEGPAALPEGVVRRGRPLAGDAPRPEAADPDVGTHEPEGGGGRPGVPGCPASPPAG